MTSPLPTLRRRKDAAKYLTEKYGSPVSASFLAQRAVAGDGPPYRLAGRDAIYEEPDLDVYGLSRLGPKIHSTSESPDRPKAKGRAARKIAERISP
jgi:hypothetical protein